MKTYKIIAFLLLALTLCMGLMACDLFNGEGTTTPEQTTTEQTPPEQTTPEQTTPEDPIKLTPITLHYAAEAQVDEQTVKADMAEEWNLPEGTELNISGTMDLNASGKYEVVVTCEGKKQTVAVLIYDNSASFTLNGKPLENGNVAMKFLEAQASENFTKGVTAVDSLGNELKIELDNRNMTFANKPGSYLAYYHATDAAGQVYTVRVIYVVTYDYNIVATDTTAFSYNDNVTIPVDFDGAADVWLEDSEGQKIDSKYYQIMLDSIVLSKEYYASKLGSRLKLRVCSASGYADFYLNVLDKEGSDLYMQQKIAELITYQSAYANFNLVKQAPAGVTFSYGYHYKKTSSDTIDKSALAFNTNGDYGYVSFDVYVQNVTTKDGQAYHEVELQLYNGVKFVSVTDSQGNEVAIVYKSNKPSVALAKGQSYHIVVDMTETVRPEFYFCWGSRLCELYFYNFAFEAPRFTYVIDNATQTIVCKKSGETLGYFAWPTVTKLDGDRLIAVASGFRKEHIDNESKVAVWYSEDGGKTWSEPQVLVDTLLDDRDSGVVYWNGKIIVSWFCASKAYYLNYNESKYTAWANTIPDDYDTKYMGGNYIISEDGGKTWSDIYSMPEGMFTPHGLIVNPDGGLTSVGYLKYDKVNKRWGTGIAVRTTTGEMDGNGFVWSEPIIIADSDTQYSWDFQEPYGIYNDDGVLIVVMRADKGLYQCELYPGETKFTDWHKIAFVQETPAHMIQHSSGVMIMTYGYRGLYVDPVTGATIKYTERNKDGTLGIRARLSYDGGLTWTREVVLSYGLYPASNSSDWGYTSTVELSDGKLLTLFYQRTGSETMASIYQIVWELPEAIEGEVTLTLVGGKLSSGTYDGDGKLISTVSGQVGQEIVLPTPTQTGYKFDGWYLDYACSIPFTGTTYSQDLILYAKWVK